MYYHHGVAPVNAFLFSSVNPDEPWTLKASTEKAYSMFGLITTTWVK